MSNIQAFADQYGPLAVQIGDRIGVSPDVVLGQLGIETGWGKHVIPGTNNLGNIKDFSGGGTAATDNQTGSTDNYRTYKTPDAFGSDYVSLLSRKYPGALNTGNDATAFATALKNGGYAEDPHYVTKVSAAVSMLRKLGESAANAISGTAQAAELPANLMPGIPKPGSVDNNDAFSQRLAQAQSAAPAATPTAPSVELMPGIPRPGPISDNDAFSQRLAQAQGAQAAKSNGDVTYQMPNGGDSVTLHYDTPEPAAQAAGVLDKLGNYAGVAARGAINGFGSLAQPVVNELVALTNAGLGTHIPNANTNAVGDLLQLPRATGMGGSLVEGTANALSNPLNYFGGPLLKGANTLREVMMQGAKVGGLTGALSPEQNGQLTVPNMIVNGIGGAFTGGGLGPLAMGGGKLLMAVENRLMNALRPGMDSMANKLTGVAGIAESGASSASKPRFKMNSDGSITLIKPQPGTPASSSAPISFEVPPIPQAESKLPIDVQKKNIEIMKEIGLDTQRPSAISGDKFTAGQEYQNAKLDTNMGTVWRNQLALEQSKIKDYARGLVQATGTDAPSLEVAGQAIRAPLQGLSSHYDNAINQLYKVADERAGGLAAVVPDTFGQLLRTTSEFAGKAENTALRRGINAYAREQGIIDKAGEVQSITVEQAEGLRQYLNSQWSPQNSGLIGKIKNALDADVTHAGGDDIYNAARALHAERKNTLDNPNGIASLLNEKGPNGINQQVPDERVAVKILTMPTNQLKHVVDTINGLPDELAPQGQKALAEIKAAFAKQIYKSGDSGGTQNGPSLWNAADVTRELNKLKSKMAIVFSPAELEKFQTLNAGGHLLQAPSAYPGAAVQGHNLLVRGMIYAPSAAGAGIGHMVGGIPGAFVGGAAGNALSRKVAERAERAQANKLMEVLSNPRPNASE